MTTKAAIAKTLGVGKSAISRWARRGMPCSDVNEALAWHGSHIRTRRRRKEMHPAAPEVASMAASSSADPATRSWRDRLDRAHAQLRELELSQLRGTLLPAHEVRVCREKQCAAFRQRSLATPSRVMAQVASRLPADVAALVEQILTREIHEALAELSGTADEGE